MHKVYVYGTLMTNDGREKVLVPGRLYDLGWFPGAKLADPWAMDNQSAFLAEVIEVDDKRLDELDRYEGYDKDRPDTSLYIRRPYLDGWIYEYNSKIGLSQLIESGDWLAYTKERSLTACI